MEKDEEGMQLTKRLGQRMAWLLRKLNGTPRKLRKRGLHYEIQ